MAYGSAEKYMLIGTETAWGTGVTADKDVGIVIDATHGGSREVIQSRGLSSIEAKAINTGMRDDTHSVSVEFQHGRLLEYVFGGVSHDETTGDWVHTYTVAAAAPSFTAEYGDNSTVDTVSTHTGSTVTSAELTMALDQTLQLKVEMVGKTFTTGTTTSAAAIDALVVFPHPLCSFTINSETPSEVQEATLKFTKKVERAGGLGSELYQSSNVTELACEFSAKLGFDAKTQHDLFADNTRFTVVFTADNGTSLGSGQRKLTITLADCSLSSMEETVSVGDLVFLDISGVGVFSAATSTDDISSAAW